MNLDKTISELSKKYEVSYSQVSYLFDVINGRLFIRHPIKYIRHHDDMQMYAGLMAKKYLGIRHEREKKFYIKLDLRTLK